MENADGKIRVKNRLKSGIHAQDSYCIVGFNHYHLNFDSYVISLISSESMVAKTIQFPYCLSLFQQLIFNTVSKFDKMKLTLQIYPTMKVFSITSTRGTFGFMLNKIT